MIEKKRADQLQIGEAFDGYMFTVTPELNQQFLYAVDDCNQRYLQESDLSSPMVHSVIFIHYSAVTRSPSFYLPPGMAAVVAKDEINYLNPGRVNKKFSISWKVVDTYEKRGRPYQVTEILIRDEDGLEILRRWMNCTYIGGKE